MSTLRVALIVGALLGAVAAHAQTADCQKALTEAEARYVEGAFEDVAPHLEPCLGEGLGSVPAYRLVALAQLRQGHIAEAKLTILRILTLRPRYRPDRIQDPPTFVALVEIVRDELDAYSPAAVEAARAARGSWVPLAARAPRIGTAPAEPAPYVARLSPLDLRPVRRGPRFLLGVWGGIESYGGERGVAATSSLGEFTENAGPGAGLGIEWAAQPWVALYGTVEAARYPTLTTRKGPSAMFDEVGSFSEWVQFVTVGARLRSPTWGRLGVTAAVGGGLAVGRRDGSAQTAGSFSTGAGIEVAVSGTNRAFLEGHATFVGPGRAIDGAASASEPLDLFSGVRLGVRTRLR